MLTRAGFPWIISPLKLLLLGLVPVAALVTIFAVNFSSSLVPLIFELSFFILFMALSRLQMANVVVGFLVADHLSHLCKRLIFLIGPQSTLTYHAVVLLPMVILAVAFVHAAFVLSKQRVPASMKLFVLYVGLSVLMSMIHFRSVPFGLALGGFQMQFIPLMALLVGATLPLDFFGKFSKVLMILIFVSVPFGLYQFFYGPTLMDRMWAEGAYPMSIEAAKVYFALYSNGEFRPYSYYADHTTWGFFLALAAVVVIAGVQLHKIPKRVLWVALPVAMVGLVLCETRTPWVGFLASVGTFYAIRRRTFRRPMVLLAGVLIAFSVVIIGGSYLDEHVSVGPSSSALVNRYATIGTIGARTSAWRIFESALPKHWLLGTGYGFGSGDPNNTVIEEAYSHNMFVDSLVQYGLVSLIVFLGFFYTWLKEAFWVARMSSRRVTLLTYWIVGLCLGMLLTGNIQGPSFLTPYYTLCLGLISGEWIRLRRVQRSVLQQPVYVPALDLVGATQSA